MKLDSEEKQKFLDEARERLDLAVADLKIKEVQILSLRASKALSLDQDVNSDTGDKSRRSKKKPVRQVQFVIKDSQPIGLSDRSLAASPTISKVIRSSFFEHERSMMSPGSSQTDELLDLFPPTPTLMQMGERSKTPATGVDKVSLTVRSLKESRGSQLGPGYPRDERVNVQGTTQALGQKHSVTLTKSPQTHISTRRATSEVSIQREVTDPTNRPARSGALRRPTISAVRADKRTATVAGHGAEQSGPSKKSRLASNKEGGGLGAAVMPDSRLSVESRTAALRSLQVSRKGGRKTTGMY